MKYRAIFLSFLLGAIIATNPLFAKGMHFGVNGTVSLPRGDFGDVANPGFGGMLFGTYSFNESMAAYAEVGFILWSGKNIAGESVDFEFAGVPIQAGIKYFFNTLYVMGVIGIWNMTESWTSEMKVPSGYDPYTGEIKYTVEKESGSGSKSKFSFAPVIGYEIPIGSMSLNISGRYQYISDKFSNIVLNIGVVF